MLIETIISLTIFTVLILGVTGIISSATDRIRLTQLEAIAVNDAINQITDRSNEGSIVDIEVTISALDKSSSVIITDKVTLVTLEGMQFFYPLP